MGRTALARRQACSTPRLAANGLVFLWTFQGRWRALQNFRLAVAYLFFYPLYLSSILSVINIMRNDYFQMLSFAVCSSTLGSLFGGTVDMTIVFCVDIDSARARMSMPYHNALKAMT